MTAGLFFILAIMAPGQAGSGFEARTALAQQMDIGESAPDWLVDSETYIIGAAVQDWAALAQSKVAFITHCPVNADFFARCHNLGIRCFPYVTFYQGFASRTYEDVNLKDHKDFIEVDADGNLKRTGFWESEDAKNMYTTCPNVQGYQDAMAAWVKRIMETGADGVFVDNLSSRAPCFGPKFGMHQHIYEDQNHAFAMLLKRVRELIKQYKPDGAVLGNSAHPPSLPREFWKYLDAEMLESYICTWVSTERWFDWESHWHKAGVDLQDFVRAGKQIQALSYLGHTPYGVREDAFFCYASARLAGFVWSGGSPSDPNVADLYRLRLGKAAGSEQQQNGVYIRVFERGLAVLNPNKENDATISMEAAGVSCRRLFDIFGGGAQDWDPAGPKGYEITAATCHAGSRSIVCSAQQAGDYAGAVQTIALNQKTPAPITFSGWSRAEAVTGAADSNYALYADMLYADGGNLYGQAVPFDIGTHDWQFKTLTVTPGKPVKTVTLHALLRYKTGTAWFDDITLESGETHWVANGGFEITDRQGRVMDLDAPGQLRIPKYSGRVYLFAPDNRDALYAGGPRLTVATVPALGQVRFRVDGFDYWTHSGRWTTEYVLGPMFGKFDIVFDQPGTHTIEIVDIVPADMNTPKGYGGGERLGQFMDPSNPTQPSEGKQFKFREWEGRGKEPQITVEITGDTTVTALFDVGMQKTESGN